MARRMGVRAMIVDYRLTPDHLQQHTDPRRRRRKGGQPDHELAVGRAGVRLD